MPEPFKTFFNPDMIALMGTHLAQASDGFDRERFVRLATDNLDALELKERSRQIRDALQSCLPADFRAACAVLVAALHPEDDVDLSQTCMDKHGIRGWAVMPMTEFVAGNGLDDFDHSMDILKEMTKRFSSEFAVRAFIARDPERAMSIMTEWTEDENYHVRRLASEGSRPRLPWGGNLKGFMADPEPVIRLLERLKDDPSDYVRRSVANSLNDIAKDHPDRVAEIAGIWLAGADGNRRRLVRHACRGLVKQGHKPTLDALGFGKPDVELIRLDIKTPAVEFGGMLEFEIELVSRSAQDQNLILDYVIHHRKANGDTAPKVFKGKTCDLGAGETARVQRRHAIRPITTRVYYAGTHGLEILANGESLARSAFELVMPDGQDKG